MARSDWLPAQPMKPARLPSARNMPCSHQRDESCGSTANPTPTVITKPASSGRRLPPPPGDQQVGEEDQRHQLDAGRDAGQRALPPAGPPVGPDGRLAQVADDHGHQHQVDLAQVDGADHRLQPEGDRRRQQGRAQADPPVAVAEAAEGEPQRRHQREHVADHRGDPLDGPRQPRGDGEGQRGERGVGELERERAEPAPVVQRRVRRPGRSTGGRAGRSARRPGRRSGQPG